MAENNGNGRWLSPEEAVAAGLADTVTDNEERTAPSLAGNIARGWERLLAGIGLNRREELPADRNVLLTAGERQELLRRSATAIRQAQQKFGQSKTHIAGIFRFAERTPFGVLRHFENRMQVFEVGKLIP